MNPGNFPRCTDCKRRLPRNGLCAQCKALNAVLFALHHYTRRCPADRERARENLPRYRAVVERGGTLFE